MAEFRPIDSEICQKVVSSTNRKLVYVYTPRFQKPDDTKKCVMLNGFERAYYEEIKNMKVFEDDIWLISFPKCGCTWLQEMVWLINNDLDYNTATEHISDQRFPFLERSVHFIKHEGNSIRRLKKSARPRHIKTHLCAELLPNEIWTKNPKIVYVVRNPKDAAVSYYHHYLNFFEYTGSKDALMDAFLNDELINSPFFEHFLDFWSMRDRPNILFVTYEEMQQNLMKVMQKMCAFLGKSLTQRQLEELREHLSFENMKGNASVNKQHICKEGHNFIRKGKVGSYKEELDDDYIRKFDEWTKLKLKDTDFIFPDKNHKL